MKNNLNELKKFTKNKKQKRIIVFSVIGIVLLIGIVTLYRTFALYEEKLEFNVLQGKVPEYTSGDVRIAAIIDGEKSHKIPNKNNKYIFESVTCDNGAEAEWNNDTWKITIGNLTESKTTCTLVFKTKTLIDYLTEISSDNEELIYDETEDKNLRYIGVNPNNYVLFNDELWRIVGVMNNITDSEGNTKSRVKLIRNEVIGSYSFDNKANGVGSSLAYQGSSEWSDSALKEVLNTGAYYNRTTGNCPYGANGATTPCDFSNSGLKDETKKLISDIVWNTGGYHYIWQVVSEYYLAERGTDVYNESRTFTWTGKIGLVYPSDYMYVVGKSVRENCLKTGATNIQTINCHLNNWIYTENTPQWSLTPYIESSANVFVLNSTGIVSNANAIDTKVVVRPSLYLKTDVRVFGNGDGSINSPYELKLVS